MILFFVASFLFFLHAHPLVQCCCFCVGVYKSIEWNTTAMFSLTLIVSPSFTKGKVQVPGWLLKMQGGLPVIHTTMHHNAYAALAHIQPIHAVHYLARHYLQEMYYHTVHHQPVTRCHYDTFSRPFEHCCCCCCVCGFCLMASASGAQFHCLPHSFFFSFHSIGATHKPQHDLTQNEARQHQ